MARRDIIKQVNGFDIRLPSLQDYELWLRLANHSPVGFINLSNVLILDHEGSISRSSFDGFQTRYAILTEYESHYPETVRKLGKLWQRYYAGILGERGRYLFDNGNEKEGRRLLIEAIRRNPAGTKHYMGLLKTFLRHII
jgi:hypothetical protein